MARSTASIATRRFGLGPRPGDLDRIAADPRGWVTSTLSNRDGALLSDPDLVSAKENFARMREAQRAVQAARKEAAVLSGTADMKPGLPPAMSVGATVSGEKPAAIRKEVFLEEATARISRAVATDTPLVERLVIFWSNHFCVSALKGQQVRVMTGAFEREAIRPHVLGRFEDMLKAVEQHPAMLIFLDQASSIGPGSKAGLRTQKGLNENLAREILELHTLGVDGGYTQSDVTAFARVLTGWTVHGDQPHPRFEPGDFQFAPDRHEPGAQTVLGKRYEDRGQATGEQILLDLARHPATARHVARKLARHFVADEASPALVSKLEKTFRETGGDLKAVTLALVEHDDAWALPPQKIVPPYDFVISLVRAFGLDIKPPEVLRLANVLGQPLWQVPSPQGWPDNDGAWMGPSAIRERLRIAERVARDIVKTGEPRQLAASFLDSPSAAHIQQAVARAETREQGVELLVMSPEFLKR